MYYHIASRLPLQLRLFVAWREGAGASSLLRELLLSPPVPLSLPRLWLRGQQQYPMSLPLYVLLADPIQHERIVKGFILLFSHRYSIYGSADSSHPVLGSLQRILFIFEHPQSEVLDRIRWLLGSQLRETVSKAKTYRPLQIIGLHIYLLRQPRQRRTCTRIDARAPFLHSHCTLYSYLACCAFSARITIFCSSIRNALMILQRETHSHDVQQEGSMYIHVPLSECLVTDGSTICSRYSFLWSREFLQFKRSLCR